MFKRSFLLFLLNTVIILNTYAQLETANWFFGYHAGLNFNNTPPTAQQGSLHAIEGTASISDSLGNLLFYTNGEVIYNARHQIMQNGSGLLGNNEATNSAYIIPHPANPDLYYVFTIDVWDNRNTTNYGFRYSLVDMRLDGGLGGVVAGQKNILLVANVTEKICGVMDQNGEFWVLTLGRPPLSGTLLPVQAGTNGSYNTLYAIHIGSSGISNHAVITTFNNFNITMSHGYMKFSSDGSLLVVTAVYDHAVYLMDFNLSTGQASNSRNLPLPNPFFPYGVEFSGSGRYLYIQGSETRGRHGNIPLKLLQYDMSSSPYSYVNLMNSGAEGYRTALQMGLDGKIYVAECNYFNDGRDHISVINHPEEAGAAADFQRHAIALAQGTESLLGLPQFFATIYTRLLAENTCAEDTTALYVTSTYPIHHVTWNFGDGSTATSSPVSGDPFRSRTTHIYHSAGNYTVTAQIFLNGGATRTVSSQIEVRPLPEIYPVDSLAVCDDDFDGIAEFNLENTIPQILHGRPATDFSVTFYETLSDARAQTNPITDPSSYRNTVPHRQTVYYVITCHDTGCRNIGHFELIVYPKPDIDMNDRYVICNGDTLYLEAPAGYASYWWSTGDTTRGVYVDTAGTYTIRVTNSYGCENSKDIRVLISDSVRIDTVYVTHFQGRNNTIEVIVSGNGDYEYSLDDINYQDSNVFTGLSPGDYTVYVNDKNGCGKAMVIVHILGVMPYFTPDNDGTHDYWQIVNIASRPGSEIYIFDRYGRLLARLTATDRGWDGRWKGKPLPADDYWFVLKLKEPNGAIRIIKGHFSLIR